MSWKETNVMDERLKFVAGYLRGELNMTRLCEQFGVSRRTGYKWLNRYASDGVTALVDKSRRPHNNPHAVTPEVVRLLTDCRKEHPFWGPKKLLALLELSYPGLDLPVPSTVSALLKKHGLSKPRKRAARTSDPYTQPFLGYDRPNAVWCADFKGHFRTGDKKRCYPLTITDGFSRFIIRCDALKLQQSGPSAEVFESAFKEYGLPDAIRTDNGPPFSSVSPAGLSVLAVWWTKLGIRHERIEPGHPEQNGRHERMHRTLKAETAKPPRGSLRAQQRAFDEWRREFNEIRPHESIGMVPPATIYKPSPRLYVGEAPDPEYSSTFIPKRVTRAGDIRFAGADWYISWNLRYELVGLKPVSDGTWLVTFGPLEVGIIDVRNLRKRRGVSHRPMSRMQPMPKRPPERLLLTAGALKETERQQ